MAPVALFLLAVKNIRASWIFLATVPCLFFLWPVYDSLAQTKPDADWPSYGNDGGGTRYSSASQIDRGNVTQLKAAWTYRTGALPHDEELDREESLGCPAGKLYSRDEYGNHHARRANGDSGRSGVHLRGDGQRLASV